MRRIALNSDYLIGAVTMLVFAAIGMFVAAMLPSALRPSPVSYSINWTDDVSAVCPGEVYQLGVQVEVKERSVLEVLNVYLDAETNAPVPAAIPFFDRSLRAYPRRASYEQVVTWVVPNVPPGKYIRITAAVAKYADADPIFLELPFAVAERCD